jgi:hypothetical protein
MSKTMPSQKTFKQRVRARMTKTGESYTAARHQLLRKTPEPEVIDVETPTSDGAAAAVPADALLVADNSMRRATGKGHPEWFALLDAWGASDHNHTEIARWLNETHRVPGWWTQNITVAYERARAMRARHQMRDGFSVSATRTVAVDAERALAGFTNAPLRKRWLPDTPMRQRPTRAALTARFDWSDPPSRVVVTVVPKGERKALVSVSHERLPDAEAGERLKAAWREWLGHLKTDLERG